MASFEEKARKALDRFFERPMDEQNALVEKVLREEAELPPPDPRFRPVWGADDILRQMELQRRLSVTIQNVQEAFDVASIAWRISKFSESRNTSSSRRPGIDTKRIEDSVRSFTFDGESSESTAIEVGFDEPAIGLAA